MSASTTGGGGPRTKFEPHVSQGGYVVQQDDHVGQVEQGGGVWQSEGKVKQSDHGPLPTAGSPVQNPHQAPPSSSWFARNSRLVGAIAGGVIGGGVGFLAFGPIGALGGAAVGALAGSYLIGKFGPRIGSGPLPPPPPLEH